MTCERIDYYQAAERTNVIRLIFNSVFFCALFTAVCSFVYFYLPNAELNSLAPVASSSNASVQETVLAEEPVVEEAAEETILALDTDDSFIPALAKANSVANRAVPAKFVRGAGTASLSLHPSAINREDMGLILYRQPQTRAAVEGFYYQVTGNRETAIAILDAAETYNIPLSLAFSIAYAESRFKPYASHEQERFH